MNIDPRLESWARDNFLPCNNANATMKRAINVFGFQHCHIVATVVARCPALQTRHEHSSLQTLSALSSPCPGFKYLTCCFFL